MGSVPPLLSFLLMVAAGWVNRPQLIVSISCKQRIHCSNNAYDLLPVPQGCSPARQFVNEVYQRLNARWTLTGDWVSKSDRLRKLASVYRDRDQRSRIDLPLYR